MEQDMNQDVKDELGASNGFEVRVLSRLNSTAPPEFLDRLVLERASDELRACRASIDESGDRSGRKGPDRLPLAEVFVYAAGISCWVIEVAHAVVRLLVRAGSS